MALGNLTSSINLGNGGFLNFGKYAFDDDTQTLTWPVELQTSVATGTKRVCNFALVITNGFSTLVSRQNGPFTGPLAGLVVNDVNAYLIIGTRATPTGYTDAFAAVRAVANDPATRRAALQTHVSSAGAGHIDASLAYT